MKKKQSTYCSKNAGKCREAMEAVHHRRSVHRWRRELHLHVAAGGNDPCHLADHETHCALADTRQVSDDDLKTK